MMKNANAAVTHRLVITASKAGFVAESMTQNRLGHWSVMSRTMTQTFPIYIVNQKPATVQILVKAVR